MLYLRIEELSHEETGKGYAYLNPEDMRALGVSNWDIIEIGGKKNTAVRALAKENVPKDGASKEDETRNEPTIFIDGITRGNARVKIDDQVFVKKIESRSAIKVVLAPESQDMMYDIEQTADLAGRLSGHPITVGDKIRVPISSIRTETFYVLGTIPSGPVVLRSNTKIELRRMPAGNIFSENLSYESIGGLTEQIRKIREMVELPLTSPQVFERLGIDPPRGVLLVGSPGTGKTLLARAVARETNANFLVINGPEIIHKFYGESEARLRDVFENASRNQPCIIFLDELDAIAPKREKVSGDVEKRVVSQLLTLMDGLKDRGRVIVIGATNIPSQLDPALRRPGRFDREIVLDVPDRNGRLQISHVHTRNMPLSEDVDLERIADVTHGFVGADIENLCREAAMQALRRTMPEIETEERNVTFDNLTELEIRMDDFLTALKDVEPSAIREIFVEIPKITWNDIGGLTEIKDRLSEAVIWPLKHKELFEAADTKPPKGILLFGEPGTGKTLLAKAVANESEVNFISIKGPELFSKYVGESEQSVREIFKKAKQVSPCILFFDEIDAMAPFKGNSDMTSVQERVLSQLLIEMDGIEELRGVLVLAATNRINMVDSALLRAGRFDMMLEIPYPDEKAILQIFKIHTRNKPLAKNVNLKEITKKINGFSGADIELVCQRASIIAIRKYLQKGKGALKLTHADFEEALEESLTKINYTQASLNLLKENGGVKKQSVR